MAKIAFILLCHKEPEAIIQQARQLTAVGDFVAIHFDGNASRKDYDRIRAALASNPGVAFARQRVRCGWGEWSLVEATLLAIEAALDAFPRASHFYMISGDCLAIKSASYAHRVLDADEADYIESNDFYDSGWIKTGIRDERLIYRHWFNERAHKRLFYASMKVQQRLGMKRAVPEDLAMQIGSQWWCLRRRTIEAILAFLAQRRDVLRFFRRTWIPDETFFQTLVRHLIPKSEIRNRTLTFLMFTDYGMPVTFHNDHYDLLLSQDFLFARKVAPEARELRKRLGMLYASDREEFRISDEGRRLFAFLTKRGRVGQRFAPRFWEKEGSLGRDRELLIVASKKWHVAKRLVGAIKHFADIPALDYIFDETGAALPDLGGIQSTLAKRTRHRRALMRMLFDYFGTDRLLICLDTGSLDLMQDFFADRTTVRLLEIDCDFTDAYLTGHARRVGLAGEETSDQTLAQLLPTIRQDLAEETDRLRDARFPHHFRLHQGTTAAANAAPLAAFLGLDPDTAHEIAAMPELFSD